MIRFTDGHCLDGVCIGMEAMEARPALCRNRLSCGGRSSLRAWPNMTHVVTQPSIIHCHGLAVQHPSHTISHSSGPPIFAPWDRRWSPRRAMWTLHKLETNKRSRPSPASLPNSNAKSPSPRLISKPGPGELALDTGSREGAGSEEGRDSKEGVEGRGQETDDHGPSSRMRRWTSSRRSGRGISGVYNDIKRGVGARYPNAYRNVCRTVKFEHDR
jgi:hypothetical protein